MGPGIIWAYRNTSHESTGEKPSYLMFPGIYEPRQKPLYSHLTSLSRVIIIEEYRMFCPAASIQQAQRRYKNLYDRKAMSKEYRVGDWVLVKFPADETGRNRKLARPWHGPYRIVTCEEPDITVSKVYFAQDGTIQVHQSRVAPCSQQGTTGMVPDARDQAALQSGRRHFWRMGPS